MDEVVVRDAGNAVALRHRDKRDDTIVHIEGVRRDDAEICVMAYTSAGTGSAVTGSAVTDLIFSIAKRDVTFLSATAEISFL